MYTYTVIGQNTIKYNVWHIRALCGIRLFSILTIERAFVSAADVVIAVAASVYLFPYGSRNVRIILVVRVFLHSNGFDAYLLGAIFLCGFSRLKNCLFLLDQPTYKHCVRFTIYRASHRGLSDITCIKVQDEDVQILSFFFSIRPVGTRTTNIS